MRVQKSTLIIAIGFILFVRMFGGLIFGQSDLLKAYCGAAVLKEAFSNLSVIPSLQDTALQEVIAQADQRKGLNSLYELKEAAAKEAGLKVSAVQAKFEDLQELFQQGQLIASITGNRHFCLIRQIDGDQIKVYIPGINYENPAIRKEEFLEAWDNSAILVVSNSEIRTNLPPVPDDKLQEIFGGQPCSNCSGSSSTYSGSGGDGRQQTGNESGRDKDASSEEPVILRNGDMFLTAEDISIPARGQPLNLTRYYNSETVSEVWGWMPEPCAGSWVIENGEYSGQGNRVTSDIKAADFTLELDMQTIQPGANYAWETGWINFRYTEDPADPRKAKDCYYFLIHTDGKIELSKWKAGKQSWLYNTITSYKATNKNHIKIEAVGSNIKIYINGSLRINYTDSDPVLQEGRIALESYFSHTHFDNVQLAANSQTYNYDFNNDDNEFIFGYGWTHSYSLRIKEYTNHVTLYRENNHKEIYAPQGDGTYKSFPENHYDWLTKDTGGFSLKTKYGTLYRFDLAGRLQYIDDRNLNRATLAYSDIGGKTLLTSITEPAGRKIMLEYGANNMVSKASDPAGNFLQYSYDASGHLVKVTDRNGNTTNYAYDAITQNLIELTDPQGDNYKYNYTYNDRVNDQLDPLGNTTTFDYLWSTVHVINKRGQIYKYNFDANGFLQSIADPLNNMERTNNDADGNITNYYDKKGNHTYYTYDANANRTGIYDAATNWTKFTYDTTYSLPTTITDARGNTATLAYDAKGNLTKTADAEGGETVNSYNNYGQIISITDPKKNITKFTYDTYGYLAASEDAAGNITAYTYDILGRLTKTADALGNATEYTYDKNGNLLTVKDGEENTSTYAYNKNDKLASVTDPLGNVTLYAYDCFGNLLKVTDASGNETTYSYDTADQMHFNKANLLAVADAKGNKTNYEYDSLDRLTKTSDPLSGTYQFGYDSQGNLTNRTDSNAKSTVYQYDVLNRMNKITYPDSTTVVYTLDAIGNITKLQDAAGATTYTYDKVNRLKSYVYPDAVALNYSYDLNGSRTSLDITTFGKTAYEYDSLNRLTKITAPDGKITQFAYDKISRRTQLNYPNGAAAVYGYDKASRLIQLINKDKSSVEVSKFIYTYDKAGRRTKVDLANGTLNYTYDKLNQLTQEAGTVAGKSVSGNYGYDNAGNRLTITEGATAVNYTSNELNQLIQTVDDVKKLIQVKGTVTDANPVSVKVNGIIAAIVSGQFAADNVPVSPGANTLKAEALDAAGNVNTHQINVTYNAKSAISYAYDKNGNLSQRKTSTATEDYTYDFENRLKTYVTSGQNASYIYNGQGQRVSKTVNGVTTKYYYDGDELVLEKTGAASIYYIHGPRIDEIIADSRGYCYQVDGLGSVVNLTDSSGAKVNTYDYKAFGVIRSQSGAVSNNWLFTGRQYDPESNLYFYRNRYYDARVGRFITQDPIGFAGGMNLYGYCGNNPISGIDPLGTDTYYVNYELFADDPIPTDNLVSHSYVATTDSGIVTDTYSWGNNRESRWFHNDPTDMRVAQNAIDSNVGVRRYGGESTDYYVNIQFRVRQNDRTPYSWWSNNCKENAASLLRDAMNLQERRQNK